MKQFLLISLICLFSLPVYAVEFYDISEQEAYAQALDKKFHENHKDGSFTGEDYHREVSIPFYHYMAERQKTDKSGLEPLLIQTKEKKKSLLEILRGY